MLGESGVGKSTLARALAETLESDGRTVRFVLGTQTGRTVTLGAFYRLVTLDPTHEPAVTLAAAHRAVEQQENLVIVVDDAQLLDPLSATLVHQLAVSGSVRLIMVIRSGEAVPDAVTALWKEQLLPRVNIKAFTQAQTAELARGVLGGVVDNLLIDELYHRSAGNLLLLRGLLSAGRESGVLVETETGWQLRGSLRGDDELYNLLEFRLRSLTPEELEVIEVLATAEVLDWDVLRAVCDAEALARLERWSLIQLVADGSQTVGRLNHPIIGEAAIRHAGVARTRQLNTLLAQQLCQRTGEDSAPSDLRTQIKLAQFMMRSDLPPDLDVITQAAASAVSMSDIVCGEELARFAFDRGGGFPAAMVLAEAISWQGRGDETEAVLGEFEPDPDQLLTVRWGCLRMPLSQRKALEYQAITDQRAARATERSVGLHHHRLPFAAAVTANRLLVSRPRHAHSGETLPRAAWLGNAESQLEGHPSGSPSRPQQPAVKGRPGSRWLNRKTPSAKP